MPTLAAPTAQARKPTAAPAPAGPAVYTVPHCAQWLAQTEGRIAPDPYSWLQAVHWFHEHGPRAHDRSHGPRRVGRTTLRLAVILARLSQCRPGVDTLVSWLKLSERTVQYHLAVLRETGLLTYISQGTRISGVGGRASEFARTVPPLFDKALGVRTGPSETYIRAVRGIDEAFRPLMARLGKKARRSLSTKRTKVAKSSASSASSAPGSCTPRGVTTSTSSPAGSTSLPSESKLGNGKSKSPSTPKKTSAAPARRRLNAVGRRHQLALELIQQLDWLGRAAVPRIAWIVRHVADAGWTASEVIAVVSQETPARHIRRPSGFLAARLHRAHLRFDTPAKRQAVVEGWRESRQAQRDRHTEWAGEWQPPASRAVARQVNEVFAHLSAQDHGPSMDAFAIGADGLADLEQLTRDEVIDLRAAALKDHGLIWSTVTACGEAFARRLFTHRLVDQARALRGAGRLVLHTHWGRA